MLAVRKARSNSKAVDIRGGVGEYGGSHGARGLRRRGGMAGVSGEMERAWNSK